MAATSQSCGQSADDNDVSISPAPLRALVRRLTVLSDSRWLSRAAAWGLVGVLFALGAAAVAGSSRQGRVVEEASRSAHLTDGLEEARHLALVQHVAHQNALAGPTDDVARSAHARAATQFSAVLESLRGLEGHDQALQGVVDAQSRYMHLTARFFDLVMAGQHDAALVLHETELEPLEENILAEVERLVAASRSANARAHQQLRADTTALRIGTPIALGAGLLLLALFGMIGRSYQRAVVRQASVDELTGLPNRRVFRRACEEAMRNARHNGATPVVLLLDLNNFKQVNDTLGHHVGDQLLVAVAQRLSTALRDHDTVARLGGDEFAVLLTDGGREGGDRIADRIAGVLREPVAVDGVSLAAEASMGIAVGVDSMDVGALLRQADTAMYVAKASQLSHVHYTAEQDVNTLSRLTLLNDLRRAIEADEFVLHFQPKIDTHSGRVSGVEALSRWQHPTRGLVYPDGFIDALDSTTFSYPFTLHVIKKALAHTRTWLDRGYRLPVAVNVSSRCLMDRRLPDSVAELLDRAGVPPDTLCLEVTETSLMTDPQLAMEILARLRALGVRTSIDDFGAGYSSMTYLKLLPVDELKIDRSFVGDMCSDPRNSMLVQAAIDLGHNFGLAVVAEGIEDMETYAALQQLGCDVGQGYYFARPMPADAFAEWFERHSAACDETVTVA